MDIVFQFFILALGLILLWKGGDLAVKHAIQFSVAFKIESFTIGFFIFAISTGLPEIISVFVSTLQKVPELSAGDLMGSSLFNISFILGLSILLAGKIPIKKTLQKRLILTIAFMAIIYYGSWIAPSINLFTAILLIAIYIISFVWFRGSLPRDEVSKELKEMEDKLKELQKNIILPLKAHVLLKLFGSLALLVVSAWVSVYSASAIVDYFNLDLSLFGATLIAIGTGLPELSLEINAIRQKEYSLALGDIFGSSLLNISLILGVLGLINPGLNLSFVIIIIPFFTLCILIFGQKLIRQKPVTTLDGCLLIGCFFFYLAAAGFYLY